MTDDIDGPDWDPPELLDSDAPEIYIAGAGRVQQVVRTLSAVVATAAIVWGVLWLGDESTKQTDLMRDQTELVEQQNTILACHSEQERAIAFLPGDASATSSGPDWVPRSEQEVGYRDPNWSSGLDWDAQTRLSRIFRECRGE
jgi:YD repeat-containing protein